MKVIRQIILGLALLAGYLACMVIYVICDAIDTIDAWRGRR